MTHRDQIPPVRKDKVEKGACGSGRNLGRASAQATKENAPNLTHEKKCLNRALPTYSRDLCSMMKLWIGSSMPCIRATLTRNDLDVMRLLVYRTNKANYRTDLISSTTIGLTDLSNRISLNVSHGSGDRLRSV